MSEEIRISIRVSADTAKVWKALTNPEDFTKWFSSCKEMQLDLTPGGKAVFTGGSEDGDYKSEGKVLDVIEGKKLFHTVAEGFDPLWYGALMWLLEQDGDSTRITLSEGGFDGHEEDMGDIEEGWRALLLSLCRHLEGSDTVDLPQEHYEGGFPIASASGYTYAGCDLCWKRLLGLHGNAKGEVSGPYGLIGDLAPRRKGTLLDIIEEKKLMYTWPHENWEAVACWSFEDMGSETKLSLQISGYEERNQDLTAVQKVCDELMDRLVAGLEAQNPEEML